MTVDGLCLRHVLYIMTVEGICLSKGYKKCPLYYDLKVYVIQGNIRHVLYIKTVEGMSFKGI